MHFSAWNVLHRLSYVIYRAELSPKAEDLVTSLRKQSLN